MPIIGSLREEIEVPAEQIYHLHSQQSGHGCKEHRTAPFGQESGAEIHIKSDVQGHQRHQEQRHNRGQLTAGSGRAGPVPAQTIPPESRCYFDTHAVGRAEQASASQGHIGTFTAVALHCFSQAERLETAASAAGAGVILIERDDLLMERQLLIRLIEH